MAHIAITENLKNRLNVDYPNIEAEVVYGVRKEYVCTVADYLARRSRLAFLNSQVAAECVDRVYDLIKKEIPWTLDEAQVCCWLLPLCVGEAKCL